MNSSPAFLDTASSGDALKLHEEMRERALGSLYFFSKVVLGYKEMARLHIEFCEQIQNNREKRKHGYLMPRGHFKSTIISKSYPLWRVCQNRETRVLIVGESDTVATKNMRDIRWNIENNQMLRWLFPEIIPPDTGKVKWTDSEILLPRERSYDESTITMIGVGAKTTGFHYDLIVYDDMIGEKAAKSEAEMQSAINWFKLAPGLHNDPAHGEEILIGTRWKHGRADLYGYIMDELPAETHESGRSKGFSWYIRSAIENGECIFPERFTIEVLDEIRKREGDYFFSCQYMNDPIAPGASDFDRDSLHEYVVSDDNRTIVPTDGTPPARLNQLLRLSFFDPSAGGRNAKAENAIVTAGMTADKRLFIIDAWSKNCGMGEAVEEWHRLNDRFIPYKTYYESVGAHKAVGDIILERRGQEKCRFKGCEKIHRRLEPIPFLPPGGQGGPSKEERIRTFVEPLLREGRIYLRKGMVKLKNQIISFPHGDMVDLLDAMAYCAFLARPPLSDEMIADERERNENARTPAKQRCNTTYHYGGYC